ncbi:LysR family transcriptional regulator [Sporosarcina cyprini]|uniref:LysR family transcriptional regulator n=1 Tax=Sporosarcina cyprini TaxID=2910523 RepID=UPI001EE05B1F|nr:LysR family transcriptional regulator [Sporosarcina cyprini]MCG3088265.1 LysR family transcriptional regulator [Sporosarcina cyprini]
MDLEKLRYFVKVVESGSVSKAAISLNMTQPPLSIAIRKLEEELGVELFSRNGKRLTLTETGLFLYERGKELLLSSMEIKKEVAEYDSVRHGTVTIGCSTIANITIIPEVVKRLNERGIRITTRVFEGNTAFILEQLRLHKMDIGLVRNIFDKKDFHTTALLSEPLYVALPPEHPLADKETVELKELEGENFLMPHTTLGYGISDFILEGCDAAGFTPNVIYWGTETFPMLNMVYENLGIAFAPSLFRNINYFKLPPLVRLTNPTIEAKLNLVTLKNSIKTAATEQFLAVTKEVIEELPIERK